MGHASKAARAKQGKERDSETTKVKKGIQEEKTVELRMKTGDNRSHADLAMQAARNVARARRRSQKAKMGHVVCHHLLLMLNGDAAIAVPGRRVTGPSLHRARAKPLEDKQFSLSF